MNWDAIGAVAESIGALGVIFSLLYLAIQVRQNTTMMKREISRENSSRFQSISSQQMVVEIARPLAKVYYEDVPLEDLTYVEQLQLDGHLNSTLLYIQDNYEDYQQGIISLEKWNPNIGLIQATLKPMAARTWWSSWKGDFTESFRSLADGLCSK